MYTETRASLSFSGKWSLKTLCLQAVQIMVEYENEKEVVSGRKCGTALFR